MNGKMEFSKEFNPSFFPLAQMRLCAQVDYSLIIRKNVKVFNPFTATGTFHRQPPRWPTFLAMLFQNLKEGMGLSLSDELEVQL